MTAWTKHSPLHARQRHVAVADRAEEHGSIVTAGGRWFPLNAISRSAIGLRQTKRFARPLHILRFDPQQPAVTAGAGAEGLHGSDVDLGLSQFAGQVSHRAWPVFALDQKAALLFAQLKTRALRRLREGAAIFRDEVHLGFARAVRKSRDAQ